MKKPIIAVDADDTIFDENTAVRLFHNETYGTKHTDEDYLTPSDYYDSWANVWGVDKAEADKRYEAFILYKLEHNIPPLADALAVLKELQKDYELVVVTSRDERGLAMTHSALMEHYADIFSDVHFVPLWGGGNADATKAEICKAIGAGYLIDDSYDHCVLAAEVGVEALLFGTYGWNQHQPLKPGMIRALDWAAVQVFFDGQR